MCLWFVQFCRVCNTFTPLPDKERIICSNINCLRRFADPTNLTDIEKHVLLNEDCPCKDKCSPGDCGLLVNIYTCGLEGAIRNDCDERIPRNSDSEDRDNFDDWSVPDNLVEYDYNNYYRSD